MVAETERESGEMATMSIESIFKAYYKCCHREPALRILLVDARWYGFLRGIADSFVKDSPMPAFKGLQVVLSEYVKGFRFL